MMLQLPRSKNFLDLPHLLLALNQERPRIRKVITEEVVTSTGHRVCSFLMVIHNARNILYHIVTQVNLQVWGYLVISIN